MFGALWGRLEDNAQLPIRITHVCESLTQYLLVPDVLLAWHIPPQPGAYQSPLHQEIDYIPNGIGLKPDAV